MKIVQYSEKQETSKSKNPNPFLVRDPETNSWVHSPKQEFIKYTAGLSVDGDYMIIKIPVEPSKAQVRQTVPSKENSAGSLSLLSKQKTVVEGPLGALNMEVSAWYPLAKENEEKPQETFTRKAKR